MEKIYNYRHKGVKASIEHFPRELKRLDAFSPTFSIEHWVVKYEERTGLFNKFKYKDKFYSQIEAEKKLVELIG